MLPNPWLELAEKYHIGDLVEGKVVSVLEFGAFVEIQKGLQGLVHISEIGYLNIEDPKSAVKKGDPVLVKIMGIDSKRERVSLSMRRVPVSEQMEWMMNLEDALESDRLDADQEEQFEIEGGLAPDADVSDVVSGEPGGESSDQDIDSDTQDEETPAG